LVGWVGIAVAFTPYAFGRAGNALFRGDREAFMRWDDHFGQVFWGSLLIGLLCGGTAIWTRRLAVGVAALLAPLLDFLLLLQGCCA
jgi:hypothetical protein